jgi:hypothetical protein
MPQAALSNENKKVLLLGQERHVHMRPAQALLEALSWFGGFL